MKILITGGSGQLGRDCTAVLKEKYEVTSVASRALDIADGNGGVPVLVQDLKPDVILNCAAFTRVDDCETLKTPAWKVNVEGAKHLASAAGVRGARMIHISTDYVFDGKKPVPESYTENDKTHPLSYYGLTKLEGGKAVCGETDRYTILRTAWLYGAHGGNFLKTMLRLTLNDPHKEIKVVHDQFGSPTWSYRLAEQIERVMAENANGVFHATSEGHCTWFDLATAFLDEMGSKTPLFPAPPVIIPPPRRDRPIRSWKTAVEGRRPQYHGDWRADLIQFVRIFQGSFVG
jgi:dTDP-4-dehydrorhamnose reductase